MAEVVPYAVRGWRGLGARVIRRTLVESLYLLTAPVTAAAGLLLVLGGLCAGAIGLLLPGGSPVPSGALALARWSADVERWRIATARSLAAGAKGAGAKGAGAKGAARPKPASDASDPGLWLDVMYAVIVLPVVLVTTAVTGLWWAVGVITATFPLRHQHTSGPLRQTRW